MIQNSVVIHSSQLSRLGIKEQVLSDGSSVRVKIIGEKGNGKYTGVVGGVKVNLTSAKPMKLGSTFIATISSKNGVIYVTPKSNEISFEKNILINQAQDSQIMNFLSQMGINADNVYVKLLQQMKQLEMKFDVNQMKKLHNIIVRMKGKEKSAIEILSILSQKGIEANEDEVLELINYLEQFEGEEEENNFVYRGNEQNDERNENLNQTENDEKKDNTSLLNEINSKMNGWFCITYELYNIIQQTLCGKGVIRLLFTDTNNLKMMNISCVYESKKYLFNLNYEDKKCTKIKFNISKLTSTLSEISTQSETSPQSKSHFTRVISTPSNIQIESEITKLKKLFSTFKNQINIEWAESQEIEGTAFESEKIFGVGGEV